ncbi:MAG: septal ring lytic transglycosylase RlpA family protein [Gammaproteobacteria bacterium]|nr:septal ring lytic transglycosylase RlpA family protein [Gammaproteobacteria bacterium]
MANMCLAHRSNGPSGRDCSCAHQRWPTVTWGRQMPRLLLGFVIALLLSACGSREIQDGAPDRHVDASGTADAVPRIEPYSKYGNPRSYQVAGKTYYVLDDHRGYQQQGQASWYGTKFHGRRTSSGEPYDMYAMTAAHKTLPIPSYVEVTNLENGRKAILRVNDRGPFIAGRIIDLSYVAAKKLGVYTAGTARVNVRAIDLRKSTTTRPATNPPAATGRTGDDQVYLQVGAFGERANAELMLSRLISLTGENVLINSQQQVYRVHIGPLGSEQAARQLASRLSPHGINDAHVIRGE